MNDPYLKERIEVRDYIKALDEIIFEDDLRDRYYKSKRRKIKKLEKQFEGYKNSIIYD